MRDDEGDIREKERGRGRRTEAFLLQHLTLNMKKEKHSTQRESPSFNQTFLVP